MSTTISFPKNIKDHVGHVSRQMKTILQ